MAVIVSVNVIVTVIESVSGVDDDGVWDHLILRAWRMLFRVWLLDRWLPWLPA